MKKHISVVLFFILISAVALQGFAQVSVSRDPQSGKYVGKTVKQGDTMTFYDVSGNFVEKRVMQGDSIKNYYLAGQAWYVRKGNITILKGKEVGSVEVGEGERPPFMRARKYEGKYDYRFVERNY